MIEVMKNIIDQSQSAVRVEGELGDWFRTTRGTRQGDPISPTSFITYLERMMEGMKEENEGGVKIQERRINNLRFADDIGLIEENRERLQESLTQLMEAGEKVGVEINISKTKTMVNGMKDAEEEQSSVKDKKIENITEFVCLGSLLTDNNAWSREVQRRIARATGAMKQFGKIWRSKNISTGTKINILKATVMSVVM